MLMGRQNTLGRCCSLRTLVFSIFFFGLLDRTEHLPGSSGRHRAEPNDDIACRSDVTRHECLSNRPERTVLRTAWQQDHNGCPERIVL